MPHFYLSERNPNDAIGGGGCVCSELKCEDCIGPYAIFPGTEMANNLSPHTVLSLECAAKALRQAKVDPSSILAAGEPDVVATAVEIT